MADTVQLFITCILDTFYPEIGQAVIKVSRAGWGQGNHSEKPDLLRSASLQCRHAFPSA